MKDRQFRELGFGAKVVAGVLAATMAQAVVPTAAFAQKKPAPVAPGPRGGADKGGAGKPPNLADARKHYAAGEKLFGEQKYEDALKEFEAADAIKASPNAARYIGLCYDNLGRYSDAIAAYDRFLAAVPSGKEKQADELRAREAQIKAMPGKVHVETTPAGASVMVDGKPAGQPTPTDVDVAPGAHKIHLQLAGYEAIDKDVTVDFASKQSISETLAPKPQAPPPPVVATAPPPTSETPPPPPPAPAEPRSKVPAYVTGGLAIAAAGVGAVFGVMALGDKSDYDKNPTSSTADSGENHALIADMAFFVAVTLGVTSAVLFFTKDDAPAAAAKNGALPQTASAKKHKITITPAPIITPTGGGAGAVIRF